MEVSEHLMVLVFLVPLRICMDDASPVAISSVYCSPFLLCTTMQAGLPNANKPASHGEHRPVSWTLEMVCNR